MSELAKSKKCRIGGNYLDKNAIYEVFMWLVASPQYVRITPQGDISQCD
jgi:hypothetical protein